MKRHSSAERAFMRFNQRRFARIYRECLQEAIAKRVDAIFEETLYGDPSSVKPVGILGTSPVYLKPPP